MLQELHSFGHYSGWDALKFLENTVPPQPVEVLYLDHDPAVCACNHATQHLGAALGQATTVLSTVWHLHHPLALDHYWDHGVVYTTLGGFRIPEAAHLTHPLTVWAGTSRGNYDWLAALALALGMEYRARNGGQAHPAAQYVMGLLPHPHALHDTAAEHMEPPCFAPVVQDADGFVDALASYRAHYVAQCATLVWPPGRKPHWLAAT